ncbi:nucleotide sugar dehydrogenase [Evansella tamaricis]|uniref:Nucleotide sugar dehydrogenase n=1 Tax=Evansella tamaricis TaxID=2069301 RepID=A0ABS6JI89_9BACI|nr:nucleotide sugar dehydrogenase [Evansella tamaricis]MBU9713306.1 nucleotide sugar dehydrogenase [Evansella tamaricis]
MEKHQYFINLKRKFTNNTAKVGVIGLGYVGLPLALELSKKGYTVYGIDVNGEKLASLKNAQSYIRGVSNEEVAVAINSNSFFPTEDFSIIRYLDSISICVPTPLTTHQEPDVSYIKQVMAHVKQYMHKEFLIILESTSYPGTTDDLIQKVLENEGYTAGKDYFLCFSPERVDPANEKYSTKNTPKIVGGVTGRCTELAKNLYEGAIETIVPVSNPKVAEMSKLLENTFRSVNIGFINEMALLCERMGLDIWETIDAASTKPFGFMPFLPGPGIGGHCIPLDPMYLSWKARGINFYSRYIDMAQEINKSMPIYVVNKIGDALNSVGNPIKGAKLLLLGMAYKPNIDDVRESPSLEVYKLLREKGAMVEYNDPHVNAFDGENGETVLSVPIDKTTLPKYDGIILMTNHDDYDYREIAEYGKLIMDTRNGFKNIRRTNIYRLWGSSEW